MRHGNFTLEQADIENYIDDALCLACDSPCHCILMDQSISDSFGEVTIKYWASDCCGDDCTEAQASELATIMGWTR